MLSATFLIAARSPRIRRVVESVPTTRRMVERFVAGETIPDAVSAAAALTGRGRHISLDVLGEDVTDLRGARAVRDAYVALLHALHEGECAATADVSLKLSALGQQLPDSGTEVALDHARQICVAAEAVGCSVTLDMEDHTTVDSTLAIGSDLRVDFPEVGNVLQSNLRRTPGDLADLATSRSRIRLVKGAYREPAHVAHQRKSEVDEAYARDIATLMHSSCYPMVATHDPEMLAVAAEQAARSRRSPEAWEVQMLYGVRTDLQQAAVDEGQQIRVYIPFGTDWYGYFMRRLAERPANVAFLLRALRNP